MHYGHTFLYTHDSCQLALCPEQTHNTVRGEDYKTANVKYLQPPTSHLLQRSFMLKMDGDGHVHKDSTWK